MVQREYTVAAACADDIVDYVRRRHGCEVSGNEWMYLAMHIERVRNGEARRGGKGE